MPKFYLITKGHSAIPVQAPDAEAAKALAGAMGLAGALERVDPALTPTEWIKARVDPAQLALYRKARSWGNHAFRALEIARKRHAEGEKAYDSSPWAKPYPAVSWQADKPGLAHISEPARAGLRHVGNVEAEGRRGDIWANRDTCGWYTDPQGDVFKDGTGLVWGVVYQLPSRGGRLQFVAGYQFGGVDGGPTLDLGNVYSEPAREWVAPRQESWGVNGGYWAYCDNPKDSDAARQAARAADSMAQYAAELERDYQTAWQAGRAYADAVETAANARKELSALLTERRAAKARISEWPAPVLCRTIDAAARGLIRDICRAKAEAAEAIAGNGPTTYWNDFDKSCRDAFCDAAGLANDQFNALR